MVLPALARGGYTYRQQAFIGTRLGGRRHKVDILATDANSTSYLISLKWQQGSGTAEQKVPFEVMCLMDAIAAGKGEYRSAYVVLGGEGWSLRNFFTSGELGKFLAHVGIVSVVTLETFVAKANRGAL
jgi:hypothetical protein